VQDQSESSSIQYAQQAPSSAPDQDMPSTESAIMPTHSADSQDNGWGEHADWDFQDVPLGSPRSSNRHPGASRASSTQKAAAHAPTTASDAQLGVKAGDKQLEALQQENAVLTRRLKHVETVSLKVISLFLVLMT